MIAVVVVFGVPLVVAAIMLSPQGLDYTVNAVVRYAGIMLLLLPIAAWPLFLIQAAAPRPGHSRLHAIVSTWLGGAVISSALMNLLASMLEYSPRPLHFDPTGHELIRYDPQAGFLLGAFTICMLLSTGCWGVLARILPGRILLRGAVLTGLLLFGAVAGLGYLLFPQQSPAATHHSANRLLLEHVRPELSR